MPRYRLLIEYDGSAYQGWQRQETGPSVQAAIEQAIVELSGQTAPVFCAGRTDAGVHALGQVAHVDLARNWRIEQIRMGLNSKLADHPIAILRVEQTTDAFHARFDATARHYLYRISNRRSPPALDRKRVWHHPLPLDIEAMHEAAQGLLGHHDFTSFRASQCQAKSPLKTLDHAYVRRHDDEIHLRFRARSFLHNQVRAMTGTLVEVGAHRRPITAIAEILAAKDRTKAGQNAPPHGLYLVKVDYPADAAASGA